MRVLVIGRGSAAKRHTRVLESMGHAVQTEYDGQEYAVIASLTPNHARDLKKLNELGFKGKCLVEKPLFMNVAEAFKPEFPVYVGYQLRFHRAIPYIYPVNSVQIHCGQSIELWGGSYHGDLSKGGGVLRDYSHEIDLINWLFGKIDILDVVGSPAQEFVHFVGRTANGTLISSQFNYFDDPPVRRWETEQYRVDFGVDDSMTEKMHKDILSDGGVACTYDEALAVNRLIDRIEA